MIAIKNARILTITQGVIDKGTILIKDGKIVDVGVDIVNC
jgi:imidazolonepropionase-like amidohydrolase